MAKQYLSALRFARFYAAGMQKFEMISRVGAEDYKWNKKSEVVTFFFLC